MDDNILFPHKVFAFLLMQSYQPQASEKTILVRSEFNNPIMKTRDTSYQKNDSKQNENTTNFFHKRADISS